MALLDRLRPQPAWKHADPAVRLASLDTLAESDLGVIAILARTDESPRVRRAAIARLTDADALGTIARGDVDTQVRADALARLLTLALDGTDIVRAGLAARALREERALVQVAPRWDFRSARHVRHHLVETDPALAVATRSQCSDHGCSR